MRIFRAKKQLFAVSLPGVILGILYVKLIIKSRVGDIGIFSETFIKQYKTIKLVPKEFLFYLLAVRLIPFTTLMCFMFTKLRKAVCVFTQIWVGFTCALLVTAAVEAQGVLGAMLCFIGMFPQFLMYIPAYIVIIWYGYTFPSNHWNIQKTLFVFLTMCAGILLETYVNPILMRMFLKII